MTATVHLYVFDGYADWEPAFAIAGIADPRFQREPGAWQVKTVASQVDRPIRSMGGVTVLADLALDELLPSASALLIVPGGAGWELTAGTPADDEPHRACIARARAWLEAGVPVAAICGATAGLARAGILDQRPHTSNALAYLKGTGYAGSAHYVDQPAVGDGDLITAGGMAPVEFAREIFARLDLYDAAALDAWYQLYKTGESRWFARLAQAGGEGPGSSDESR
ncbi:MAG TPA: DJ-1/PfpI family protein [Burkholderiaceae bacterium]|nr:DJ-1/PfpI family protein [Burkholderiaceae bacterium]